MVYIRVFYNKCPTCKQTWSAQLSHADVVRIGKEVFICKCGVAWETGHVEWAHLTPAQRRGYFLSTAEIGVFILAPFVGGLFAFFVARNRWFGLVWGLLGGFVVAAVAVAFMWSLKYVFVRLSLRRCPFDRMTTPLVYDLFDQLQDPLGAAPRSGSGQGLMAQLRQVPYSVWVFLALAALSWIRIETLWPVMFISLIVFARILRRIIPTQAAIVSMAEREAQKSSGTSKPT